MSNGLITNKLLEMKDRIFNSSVPVVGDNLLTNDITTLHYSSFLIVYCCFSDAGKISVRRGINGSTVSELLNGGSDLSAGAAYLFSIPIQNDTTINFRHSAGAGMYTLIINEVYTE